MGSPATTSSGRIYLFGEGKSPPLGGKSALRGGKFTSPESKFILVGEVNFPPCTGDIFFHGEGIFPPRRGDLLAIFGIMGSKFWSFLVCRVTFWPFLYEEATFWHFCMRGSKCHFSYLRSRKCHFCM